MEVLEIIRPMMGQTMPDHFKPIWDRLLEGPTDSRGLREVDSLYESRVELLNEWLEANTKNLIRYRPIASGNLYWIV